MEKPTKSQRDIAVETYLRDRLGQWVPGPEISNERVGGGEGKRRFRDFWQYGILCECRPMEGKGRTAWEYRIVRDMTEWELDYCYQLMAEAETEKAGHQARRDWIQFLIHGEIE